MLAFTKFAPVSFVQQAWIDIVFAHGNNASLLPDDFRATVSFFWQAIEGLCNISNTTWSDIVVGFSASHNFNPVAVTEQIIQVQVGATLGQFHLFGSNNTKSQSISHSTNDEWKSDSLSLGH